MQPIAVKGVPIDRVGITALHLGVPEQLVERRFAFGERVRGDRPIGRAVADIAGELVILERVHQLVQ
ncbi:hypothetical protein D3C83_192650 [compost metagenome]